MRILVSNPGRYGDILWSLATARAVAETYGEPVHFLTSEKYGSLVPLIQQQSYIQKAFADSAWLVEEGAPMTPHIPPTIAATLWDRTFHTGYSGWPQRALPFEHWRLARGQQREGDPTLAAVELGRPWISAGEADYDTDITIGFTDEWVELKMGVMIAVGARLTRDPNLIISHLKPNAASRQDEWPLFDELGITTRSCGWVDAAAYIKESRVFLGCCSALHVLAVALGTPAIVMEPNAMRHNDIFWPLGRTGPQVTQVVGNDGRWTFDSRHTADLVESALARKAV